MKQSSLYKCAIAFVELNMIWLSLSLFIESEFGSQYLDPSSDKILGIGKMTSQVKP